MSDPKTSGPSTTGRQGLGRLMSSSGKMAVVGAVASAATLGFTLWIQFLFVRQTEVGEPLMRKSLELGHLLDRTFVELGGWIAYGDADTKAERARLWREEITPRLGALREAAGRLKAEATLDDVAELEDKLRRLRYLQWHVEDVARSPTNVPARAAYETELAPIRTRVLKYLKSSAQHRRKAQRGRSELAADAERMLARFLETDRALLGLIENGTPASVSEAVRAAENSTALTKVIEKRWRDRPRTLHVESLVAGAVEVRAFDARAPLVIRLRTQPANDIARHLFETQLGPLQQEVTTIAERISRRQLEYVEHQGRGLLKWSFVVLGLAILLGVLSIGSLYVNYRLESRVQRALDRAKSLGQYVVEERVGGGGMGEVYRARHALLRRPAAVKVLRGDSALDLEAQERFREEVQVTSRLTHPNTIAIYDYGRTPDGLFYYAMELLEGVTLDLLVQVAGPLPPARVVYLLRQICGSLEEAHQQGLLHRDIKPTNVMVAELGGRHDFVKVLDFGLATLARAPRSEKSIIVGTPAYLAPEAIRSETHASPP